MTYFTQMSYHFRWSVQTQAMKDEVDQWHPRAPAMEAGSVTGDAERDAVRRAVPRWRKKEPGVDVPPVREVRN